MSTRSPDVIIVGAGIVGLFTALEFAREGLRVQILEQGTVGRQASWAGGGILSPLHPWQYPAPVLALSAWSRRQYPHICQELVQATGIDPEWTQSGLLILEPEAAEAASRWAKEATEICGLLDQVQVKALEPACGLDTGAIFFPEIAQVRNPRLLKALHAMALAEGVQIQESVRVSHLLGHGRVIGVSDGDRQWKAGSVVIAAGAWCGNLQGELIALPPIRPVKGQMLMFAPGSQRLDKLLLKGDCYLIPRRDGRIVVGSTVEDVGFDLKPTRAGLDSLQANAFSLFPGLQGCRLEAHWAGLRPGSPEGIPYISRHPEIEGLYINAGHFRHGILTAPASARLLADLILQRTPSFDAGAYAWTH